MAKFKTSAIPVLSDAASEFDSDATQNQIAGIQEPGSVTLSSIITSIMAVVSGAVQILIDPFKSTGTGKQGRIVAAVSATALGTTLAGLTGFKKATLTPMSGQSGRVLAFELTSNTVGFDATTLGAITDIVAPASPKFNVGSLATKIAQVLPTEGSKKYAIAIDQENGEVEVYEYTAGDPATTAQTAHSEDGRITVDLDMTPAPDAPSSPDTSLPFEGGEIA